MEEYARCMSYAGQYEASNRIINRYLHIGSSAEAYVTMGGNYRIMKQHELAEQAYLQASLLVPNRFTPLYQMMMLFDETGQTEKAIETARFLLEKPVKVPSKAIDDMKIMAEKILKESR